jgi:DNA-binding GntR family transcriptional regulator
VTAQPSDLSPASPSPTRGGGRDNIATIHDAIRDEILSGDLRAGTVLSQVRLAEDFGVSRGPVREALRLLQREGLVEAELNRRVRVADFSVGDLEQLYAMRILNETLAVRATVPRLTRDELQAISRSLARMDAVAGIDMPAWEEAHRHFHRGLVAEAGSRLLRLVEQLSDHAERYRRAYIASDARAWSSGSADHHRIYDAAERGDAEGAGIAIAEHLARTALTVLGNTAPNHDPTLVRGALRSSLAGECSAPANGSARTRRRSEPGHA